MDADRFNAIARNLVQSGSRRRLVGGLLAILASTRLGRAAAQTETAVGGGESGPPHSAHGMVAEFEAV